MAITINHRIKSYFQKDTQASTLALFRIFFGLMMLVSIVRFWSKGWIESLYIKPQLFFSYYGFEWVKPLGQWTYLLFFICGLSAFFVALGYKYRLSIAVFFLSFTYIELMDKTTYLNHYYFISLMSFVLIFLPANAYFSVDARRNPKLAFQKIPRWTTDSIKFMIGLVYFYAGLAKLNSDWLFYAKPLSIWLPIHYDFPLLGAFMSKTWFHFAMSWAGAIYDLTIPFLLLYRRTRWIGFALVVIFHVLTKALFPIGMFPYIMIVSSFVFFSTDFHHKIIGYIARFFKIKKSIFDNQKILVQTKKHRVICLLLSFFFVIQLLLPWRYLLYPGELFWNQEGYRFSWRVMLIESAGMADFKVLDGDSGKSFYVDNRDFLTTFQEKQMSFQPDFILEYAHYLGDYYKKNGVKNPQVYVDCFVTLNGRLSTRFIKPNVDLCLEKEGFKHKKWIIPFDDQIKIRGI